MSDGFIIDFRKILAAKGSQKSRMVILAPVTNLF